MIKREWFIVIFAYLAFAEVLSWAPVNDLSFCLIQPEHGGQTSNHDHQKYCPAFHTGVVAALDALDGFFERHDKAVVAGFTVVLAISTIGLWLATNRLWEAGENQRDLLERTSKEQARDMQASIDAAKEANILSRDIFISEQRPWLRWQMNPNAMLKKNGPKLTLEAFGSIQNLGKIPAFDISYTARLYSPPPDVAAINLGWAYFDQHMAEIANSEFILPYAALLPSEQIPISLNGDGVDINLLPEKFTLFLAFHGRYLFATDASASRKRSAEIGGVFMVQPRHADTLLFNKDVVLAEPTLVSVVEFHGGRRLT